MQLKELSTGITIGIPTRHANYPVTLSWAIAFKNLVPPINFNTVMALVPGKPVDLARNEIVAHALSQNHKYVFFQGDDTIPPNNILKQLIFRAENNKDHGIITGVYCSKSEPPAPLLFRGNGHGSYWNWKVGEYFEITGCGMDACLIRTDVFKQLSKHVGKDAQGNLEFFKTVEGDDFEDNINNAVLWTEDLYFLELVRKYTNFKVYCDGSMLCDHVDVSANKIYRLPYNSYPVTGIDTKRSKDLKTAIDLGCGVLHTDLGDQYNVIRVDIRDECNPDFRCDIRTLPFNNEYFDLVFSSHVLEHFGRHEWKDVLKEWIRVLKPEGELRLVLPNINWAIEQFKNGRWSDPSVQPHVWNVLYGGQSNSYDFHYNGWNEYTLEAALREFGFDDFEWQEQNYNMIVQAWRSEREKEGKKVKQVKKNGRSRTRNSK